MQIKAIYRALITLGAAILMASIVLIGSPRAQQAAAAAKKSKPAPKPTPEALWAMDGAGEYISVFGHSRLTQKTGAVGAGVFFFNADSQSEALTFDDKNNLWSSFCAGDSSTGVLVEFTAGELRNLIIDNGGPTGPKLVIEDPSGGTPDYLACPRNLVFDPLGNLWVETAGGAATNEAPALLEYAQNTLTQKNQVVPLRLQA
jgi:hypothetical protein